MTFGKGIFNMSDREETKLLCRIASMYYIEDMTQSQISANTGIHRTAISKLLKKAREEGIVTIKIKDDINECFELEGILEKTLGLKEAIVLHSYSGQSEDNNTKFRRIWRRVPKENS